MQHIIAEIHIFLIEEKKTVAVAESCTGGLLCNLLTRISGSSQYFILGVVAYSNEAKETILEIPHSLIARNGAVSEITAATMAGHVRRMAKSDFGIGITGIAGPTGATAQKPVGTVFIAIDSKDKKFCQRFHFRGNRISIRKKAALKALELLKRVL